MKNCVNIAVSLDGFISDVQEKLDWLPSPSEGDFGFEEFMSKIDAIVMGKNTFLKVCSFDCPWPYSKKVFVLSHTLKEIDNKYQDKAELIQGTPKEILNTLHHQGYKNLYIDGGKTIQSFLNENLIDEMTITTVPVILGEGISLFSKTKDRIHFKCENSILTHGLTQSHYVIANKNS